MLAAPLLPGTNADARREVVRTALVPPLDVSQFPSPLPGFRRYTEPNTAALYDKVVLKVTGLPAGALVRFATLDDYDGLVWGAADRSSEGVPFQQVGSRIAPRGGGTPVDVTVEVVDGGYSGYWLPTVGTPTRIEFDGPRSEELASELWLNTDTDTAVVPRRLLGGERYTMSALLPPAPAADLPKDLDVASGGSSSQDLDLLDARLDSWTSRAEGSWAKLRAVAGQMRTEGTYTDGGTPNSFEKVYLPGHATARLSRFVNSTKLAGNDEQYAATLALAGQRLGIPSRVVMGAEPEPSGEVRGRDVHAWVEVRLDDGSWFPLRASTFVPSRDKTPSEQQLKSEEQKVGAQVPPAGRRQPAVAAPGARPGAERHRHRQAQEVTVRRRAPGRGGSRCSCSACCCRCCSLAGYLLLVRWLKARRRLRHASPGRCRPGRPGSGATWSAEARSLGVRVPRRATRREQAVVVDTALAVAHGSRGAGWVVTSRHPPRRSRAPSMPSSSVSGRVTRMPCSPCTPTPSRCSPTCAGAPRAGSAGARTPTPDRCSPIPSVRAVRVGRGGGPRGTGCPASAAAPTPTPPPPRTTVGCPGGRQGSHLGTQLETGAAAGVVERLLPVRNRCDRDEYHAVARAEPRPTRAHPPPAQNLELGAQVVARAAT